MGVLQAIGRLRYGPRASTVPRKGRWLVLECDHDWYDLYAPQVARELPGRWASVVDLDRRSDGSHGGTEARLGLIKPSFQEPAWGPHVSVIRGNRERVKVHLDLWDLGVLLGDNRGEQVSMVESRKHYEAKAETLREALASMGPGVRPKYRKQHEDALAEHERLIANRTARLGRLQAEEARLERRLERLAKAESLPDYVLPGAKVQFGFDPDLKLIREHWYLDAKCRTLGRVRHFFGLSPRPVVPFHLTVAVTSGG